VDFTLILLAVQGSEEIPGKAGLFMKSETNLFAIINL
jgi:hypothetical protein